MTEIRASAISECYEKRHQHLDDLLTAFQQMKAIDLPGAGRIFREFKEGLEQRMACEEEVLFRLYEDENGLKGEGCFMSDYL